MSEESARAAEADGDFVADEMHRKAVAQLSCRAQVLRGVHRHARSTLHQRLDNDRCRRLLVLFKVEAQGIDAAQGIVLRGLPRRGEPRVARGYGRASAQ